MTNIYKLLLSVAGASLLVASCTKQETPFVPGEQDQENCQGVYFPAQEVGGAYEPDAVNNYKFSVTVARTDDSSANGTITVPVEITGSGAEYVESLEDITFEPGQKEVTVKGEISNKVEAGTEYEVQLTIKDNQYASLYSSKPSYLKFSFVIEKWNYLGEGQFMDYWIGGGSFPVQVYQNDGDKNRYRLVEPYKGLWEYWGAAYTAGGWQLCTPADKIEFTVYEAGETIVSKSGKKVSVSETGYVYYAPFNIGLHHPTYSSDIYNYSPCEFSSLADESNLEWNKVYNWQENGLPSVVYMAGYRYMPSYGGGWGAYDSGDEAVIVIFPGGALTDYTLEVEAGITENGNLPVYFTTGPDVAKVSYSVYLGVLTEGEIQAKKTNIGAGTEEGTVYTFSPDSIGVTECVLTFDSTAVYTLVAVSFDEKGQAQGDADINFGYVKAGDEEEVAITAGCSLDQLTASYIADGYSETSCLLANIWGRDVTSGSVGIATREAYETDSFGDLWNQLYELDEYEIYSLNTAGGYTFVWSGLKANTEYALLYTVSNGYVENNYVYFCSTPGLPRETVWYGKYTYNFYWTGDDIYKLAYDPNEGLYIIENWGGGVDFTFSWENDTTISVGPSYIGSDYGSYGSVYAVDAAQYWKGYEEAAISYGYDPTPCYYDSDSLKFHFNLEYIVSAGTFGDGWETFEYVSDQEPQSVGAPQSAASVNSLNLSSFKSNVQIPLRNRPFVEVEGERIIKAASYDVVSVRNIVREKKNYLNAPVTREDM